jgi:hypothetical protein
MVRADAGTAQVQRSAVQPRSLAASQFSDEQVGENSVGTERLKWATFGREELSQQAVP